MLHLIRDRVGIKPLCFTKTAAGEWLFASEIRALLVPGGVFANLDLVASSSQQQHERFRRAIGRVKDDPTDRLAGLCEQLGWLRDAGFAEVDCHFKWLELALVIARRS